jgi:hypothetical protein
MEGDRGSKHPRGWLPTLATKVRHSDGAWSARAIQYAAATFVGSEKTHGAVERHHNRSEQIEPSPHLPNFDLGARRGAVHVFILKSAPI